MMYITREQLIDRFGENEIAGLERTINDPEATTTAIEDASREVDSYLACRYVLPLTADSATITKALGRAVAVITRYYMHKNKPNDTVRQDYEDVIKWLGRVADGKAKLDGLSEILSNKDDSKPFKTGAIVV